MRSTRLIVEGELADHMGRPDRDVEINFELPVGARDLVQSAGIPHVEVDRVEIDGHPGHWEDRIDGGSVIHVWPRFPLSEQTEPPGFLLDVHLGKLARLLRLLGFDTEHEAQAADDHLASRSIEENRVLLTRDRGLLMRASIRQGRWIRAIDPIEQAAEVIHAFGVRHAVIPFSRCLECNGTIHSVPGDEVDVPEDVRHRVDTFSRCSGCGRTYWRGSHWNRLRGTVDEILDRVDQRTGTARRCDGAPSANRYR